MKIYETDLLKAHQNEWILDLRFLPKQNNYGLAGLELIIFRLVEEQVRMRVAHSLTTTLIKKKDRHNRELYAPPLKLMGIPYICYGSGSGHIGYFMSEFPSFPVFDPRPYQKFDDVIDDCSTFYLSQAFSVLPNKVIASYRQDICYHWKGSSYYLGDRDTDVGLHVFERRSKEMEIPVMLQPTLF